jgi:hypothetical protein
MTTGTGEPGGAAANAVPTGYEGWWFGETPSEDATGHSTTSAAQSVPVAPEPPFAAAPAPPVAVAPAPPPLSTPPPAPTLPTTNGGLHPTRLALGLAVLAAERLRGAGPPSEPFLTGVGLLQQTAAEARVIARRAFLPPAKFALRAATWAAGLRGPEIDVPATRLNQVVLDARNRGAETVAAGRAEASALVQSTVSDGLAWAQAQAVPQIVDGLVPHLVDEVVPRLIDGVMPEVRARVLPIIIEDLTHDPELRDLILEQGRGVVGDAAKNLRSTTANADDRVESAFRRMVHKDEPSTADVDPTPDSG